MREPPTSPFWKRAKSVWLAFAFIAGLQAALEHPVAHVDERGEFIHLHDDGHSPEDESDSGPLCDALAALTACAPEALPALAASDRAEPHLFFAHQSAPRVAEAPPFLSQGPPASV
jgi:hypothetical protein